MFYTTAEECQKNIIFDVDNDQQIDENKAINLDLGIYHNLPICYF